MTNLTLPKVLKFAAIALLFPLAFASLSAPTAQAADAPGGVTIKAVSSEAVGLSWDAYAGAAQYRVRFDWSGGNIGPKVDGTYFEWTSTSDDPRMTDANRLHPGTTYTVRIRALTASGADLSNYSNPLTFTTKDASALPELAPVDLSATQASSSSLYLAWRSRGPGFKYEVRYGTSSGLDSAPAATFGVAGGVLTGLNPASKYYFKVRVLNADGSAASEYSGVDSGTTPAAGFVAGIKVASYNVLKPGSGANSWTKRRGLLAANITANDPDVLGLQETTAVWVSGANGKKVRQWYDLSSRLSSKYAYTTTDNTSGTRLLYNKDRFSVVSSGYQRLSPLMPTGPRYAVWAILRDRTSNDRLFVINTHLQPPKGSSAKAVKATWTARNKQASAVVKLIAAKNPEHLPTVVTGDMNSSRATKPSNGAYSVYMHGGLTDPLGNANDTWFATVAGPAEQRIDVNYNSFNGMARTAAYTKYAVGTHVDYILTANVARVAQVRTVVNLNRAGKFIGTFASDHNMLTAYINLH
jgi:endonuclease/exonuclease/phosphatase family metal-dependent hydrolase